MKIETEQLKALMEAKPRIVNLRGLCENARVHHNNLNMRLRRGGEVTEEEAIALGDALAKALAPVAELS